MLPGVMDIEESEVFGNFFEDFLPLTEKDPDAVDIDAAAGGEILVPVSRLSLSSVLSTQACNVSGLWVQDETFPLVQFPRADTAAIDVQFLLAGFSDVMAVTLMTVLQSAIPRLHQRISWSFQPVLLMRDGTKSEDTIPSQKLNEATLIIDPRSASLTDLANNFTTLSETWTSSETKFVFVANVACPSGADVTIRDIPKSDLHQAANKWTRTFLQASHTTREHFRNDVVADVIFVPPTGELRDELNQLWGEEIVMSDPMNEEISPIIPRVHSTPAKFRGTPCLQSTGQIDSPIGKECLPDLKTLIRAQPSFRVRPSVIAKLLVAHTFKERVLSKDEIDLPDKFKTETSGVMGHAGRGFFLQWFGLRDSRAASIFDTALPCFVSVNRSTGQKVSPTCKFASPCGQERYCKNCEKVFDMLDTGYGLETFGNVILALITKAMPTWTGACTAAAEWERTAVSRKPHDCGPDCTGLH